MKEKPRKNMPTIGPKRKRGTEGRSKETGVVGLMMAESSGKEGAEETSLQKGREKAMSEFPQSTSIRL